MPQRIGPAGAGSTSTAIHRGASQRRPKVTVGSNLFFFGSPFQFLIFGFPRATGHELLPAANLPCDPHLPPKAAGSPGRETFTAHRPFCPRRRCPESRNETARFKLIPRSRWGSQNALDFILSWTGCKPVLQTCQFSREGPLVAAITSCQSNTARHPCCRSPSARRRRRARPRNHRPETPTRCPRS